MYHFKNIQKKTQKLNTHLSGQKPLSLKENKRKRKLLRFEKKIFFFSIYKLKPIENKELE